MLPYHLEKASKREYRKIAQIYAEEFSKYPYNENWTLKKAYEKVKILARYCDIFVIKSKKEIIGFIALNPNHWFPGNVVFGEEMAIKSEFQRRGIGTQVLQKIFRYYRSKGYKKYMGIVAIEGKALNLYKKMKSKKSKENILIEKNL